MSTVLGAIVIARNGDRREYYQDPKTYAPSLTDSTALGVVRGSLGLRNQTLTFFLRAAYLTPGSASFISSISGDIADTQQVKVRAKAGGEGSVVFDSAVALLQGLFPPSSRNKITLANETVVTAPLGGYQYIPMETVEPGNDRSLESWTDCPAFQKHVASFHGSDEFKTKAKDAAGFFQDIKDYIFGRPANLENIWNIYDFMSTQLTYNQTYAYRLPPSYIDQARALADFHEDGIFSDEEPNGVGNIAGRTLLHTILTSLERIAFNGDPLQFMLVQTSYQPFISLFHQTEMIEENPELKGIPNFGSALAIELRRGSPPDLRDFLRFKFKNGTADPQDWRLLHPFGHHADIPLTEFIYRAEGAAITSNKQWAQVCGTSPGFSATARQAAGKTSVQLALGSMLFFALFVIIAVLRAKRVRAGLSSWSAFHTHFDASHYDGLSQWHFPLIYSLACTKSGTTVCWAMRLSRCILTLVQPKAQDFFRAFADAGVYILDLTASRQIEDMFSAMACRRTAELGYRQQYSAWTPARTMVIVVALLTFRRDHNSRPGNNSRPIFGSTASF
ncbi:histidine phosphatase superfamily [Mycena alexandri]|uniref:Histidine phosphatase superfamily n=1 Tax=Mycena alexandri TaxID=1745969 RepID=A0AAD6SHD1_9AGAR|nr:histidine phosphatase superfamily [Mycena alexandri]